MNNSIPSRARRWNVLAAASMAEPRSQRIDQRSTEDSLKKDDSIDHQEYFARTKPRGRSPAVSSPSRRSLFSPPRTRKRSLSHHSQEVDRENKFPRRTSRSGSPARHLRDNNDLYRPFRGPGGSPSSSQRNPRFQAFQHQQRRSRSPARDVKRDHRILGDGSRETSTTRRRPGLSDRKFSPTTEGPRRRRGSPRRPSSPDTYTPSSNFPHRLPTASTYRPGEARYRGRSTTPPAQQQRSQRGPIPEDRHTRRPRSRSPGRSRRSPPRRGKRAADTYAPTPARQRRSPSPRGRRPQPRSRGKARSRSPRRRHPRKQDRRNGHTDMRPTYPYAGPGRGGSQQRIDPRKYAANPHQYPPAPPPPSAANHTRSPYGVAPAWPPQSPYGHSQTGSPFPPPQFRQSSYPPAHSPTGYYPTPTPPLPPPSQFYGGSPAYPQPPFPPILERRTTSGQQSPPPNPSRDSSTSSKKRALYTNLSWTPSQGIRGGLRDPIPEIPVKPAKKAKPDHGKAQNRQPPVEREKVQKVDEDDDDLFRPSKDLRAEDESHEKEEHNPTTAELEADSRFKFAFKGRNTASTKPKSAFERNPTIVKKGRWVKSLKHPPTLAPDFQNSVSVYYRKPGNESVVGSGTYGKVFRAVHVYTGEKVALKKIRMEGERDGFPVTAIREVKLLQSLNNDNIVRLQEVMVEKNDCYMVFEYLSHDLTGLINHPSFRLDDAYKKHLAKQLFEGLDYLHRRGVLHRDIKAANILISNTGQLKIADFGLARFYAKRRQLDYTNRVITIWYRSPELLLGETQYGAGVDIWSAACVMVEIFTKHAIFPGDGGELNQLWKIYSVMGTPTRGEWSNIVDMAWFELLRPADRQVAVFEEKYKHRLTPAAYDLLQLMLQYDPAKRPNAQQVLEHPYFTSEEPEARRATELANLEGDWHEFESKALRKEKEKKDKTDRDARRAEEKEAREAERERKRKGEGIGVGDETTSGASAGASDGRESKRARLDESLPRDVSSDMTVR